MTKGEDQDGWGLLVFVLLVVAVMIGYVVYASGGH